MTRRPPAPINGAHGAANARQRGAALLIAMILLTLVATLASGMIWQQWRAIQVEAAERARTQSTWILNGALDWARLILREDARTGGADHLGEPWAVPLAEARLSTFLAADRDPTANDGPEAFLSGSIIDAQAKYNLRNLLENGKPVPAQVQLLQRLCDSAGLPTDTAARIAQGLVGGTPGEGVDPPLPPQTVADLAWLGLDAQAVAALALHVELLPEPTPVNLNTASREVIAAVVPGLDLGSADRIVQARQRDPFKSIDRAQNLLPQGVTLDPRQTAVSSSFFEIRGRLRLDERVLEQRTLVQRRGLEITPILRERINAFAPSR
jgi:general secretion pathway protein K